MTDLNPLKVCHVVPHVYNEASGPTFSVTSLCAAQANAGADVQLHVLEPGIQASQGFRIDVHRAVPIFSKLGVSPGMTRALRQTATCIDVMHNHSLWMMPNVYPGQAARRAGCHLVTSPRGTFSAWAMQRSLWQKRLMWALCQGAAVRATHCFHATSESELQDIRRRKLRAPVAVIPNGINVPNDQPARSCSSIPRRLLFLGRIHPVKGIDLLLQAWRQIQPLCPDWLLQIAGPDNGGYLQKMRQLATDLQLRQLEFTGPTYGENKTRTYHAASAFVLPTRSENFGLAVAEALAHQLPVITTKEAPWSALEKNQCGWWIDCEVASLTTTLLTVLRLSERQLREYGQRGRQWMQRDFSWDRIGLQMLETYNWLLSGGSPPPWVET